MNQTLSVSRRQFLKASLAVTTGAAVFPTIVPSSVLGAGAPSKKIQIGQIGCGRIALTMDLPGIIKHDLARVVAVCDLDSKRLEHARKYVAGAYAKKQGSDKAVAVKAYGDYRELLKDPQIDAVAISTPDHWHSEPVIAAALAGKDVYVQKPLTMTLREGRAVSDILRARKRAFQIGSQQRSTAQFRIACELVRNGRIGQLRTVKIGLPVDPAGGNEQEMPVPPNLDYEMWLGCTPKVPYTEERVHPQNSITDRPGWLRIDSYCLGMITGWGSHHVDIAHWGLGLDATGPATIEGKGEYPADGYFDVPVKYDFTCRYESGVEINITDGSKNRMGTKWIGEDGRWIFVTRGGLEASSPGLLKEEIGAEEIQLIKSTGHQRNFVECVKTRRTTVTPAEYAHRSISVGLLGEIAMVTGRKIRWNPEKEEIAGDPAASALLMRPYREPWKLEV